MKAHWLLEEKESEFSSGTKLTRDCHAPVNDYTRTHAHHTSKVNYKLWKIPFTSVFYDQKIVQKRGFSAYIYCVQTVNSSFFKENLMEECNGSMISMLESVFFFRLFIILSHWENTKKTILRFCLTPFGMIESENKGSKYH